MFTVAQFFADYISTWEGGLSLNPADHGNYYQGVLIGSNRGVTGTTLAAFRGNQHVTAADIAALTLQEAVQIGQALFYERPGYAQLPWDQVIASAIDFGWGAGALHGIMLIQQLSGVEQIDGIVGPVTIAAYKKRVASMGLPALGTAMVAAREAYYDGVIARIPADAIFRKGWYNRSAYFGPTGPWWARFEA